MPRIIALFMFCSACLLWADNSVPKLSLSLEECLALAEKESLVMLRAESARQKLDFAVISQWLNYIPNLEYMHTNKYNDEQTIEDGIMLNHTRDFRYNHTLTFKERVFDLRLVNLFKNEKNEKIKREIIALSFRSAIFHIVRGAYYNALIYTKKSAALEQYRNTLQSYLQSGENVFAQLLQYHIRDFLKELELAMAETSYAVQNEKMVLLKALQKPFTTELTLTSVLADFNIDSEKNIQAALQNNVFLKKYMLEKMSKENEMIVLKCSYLPHIEVALINRINDTLAIELAADLFNDYVNPFSGSFEPFAVDLEGKLTSLNYIYDYNFTTNTWDNGNLPDNREENKYTAEITITFPLDKIYSTGNREKNIKNDLYDLELQTKEQVLAILQNLASLTARIDYTNKVLQILEEQIPIKQQILEATGMDLKITAPADMKIFREHLDTVLELINLKFNTIESKFLSQNQYITELESGTSFEVLPQ